MNKAELTAKLEAIEKELFPLFAKKGRSKEECDRVAKLESDAETVRAELRTIWYKQKLADQDYMAKVKQDAKLLMAPPKEM